MPVLLLRQIPRTVNLCSLVSIGEIELRNHRAPVLPPHILKRKPATLTNQTL